MPSKRLYMELDSPLELILRNCLTSFVFAAIILAATGAPALSATCGPTRVQVTVNRDETKVVYDRSKDIKALSRMMQGSKRADLKDFTHTLGITQPKFNSDGTYRTSVRKSAGGFCATVTRANIEIVLHQTIYVASDIKQGTCAYNLVVSHERKHAKLNSTFLAKIGRVIKDALAEADLKASQGSSEAQATSAAIDQMDAVIGKAVNAYVKDLLSKQAAVDTPEEYSRINKVCGEGAVRKLIAGASK